jgi:hypothetical protein
MPAVGVDPSLFSLEAIFCGATKSSRSCSTFFGYGNCVDAEGNNFPSCFKQDLYFDECEKVAVDHPDAIGIIYDSDFLGCTIIFDAAKAKTCPDGFYAVDGEGTGPIQSSDGIDFGVFHDCFVCTEE